MRCLRIIIVMLFSVIISLCVHADGAGRENFKYLYSFKTSRSACLIRVNNIPIVNNFSHSEGSIITGGNITSFSESGDNYIEVMMGPVSPDDINTLYRDSSCELILTKAIANSSQHVTTMKLTVDDNTKIIASSSSNYKGLSDEGPIDETQLPYNKEQDLYRIARNVKFSGLPEWSWQTARPVTDADLPEIRKVYTQIWTAMKNRDVDTLKKMTEISSRGMGIASGLSPEFVFKSYNLPQEVLNPERQVVDLEWEGAELITYCNGRLFRLAEGVYQNSPLELKNKNGKVVFTYNPYLSIINDKVVIVR